MYHCATPPVIEHIGRGMYGMIIVQPKGGYGKAMPEYAILQSELYANFDSMQEGQPSEMAFNGIPSQYVNAPINLKPNSDVRVFFLNAGPSELSSFHVVGTIFDRAYEDGNPANLTVGRQALAVPASGSAVLEMKLVGEGKFPFVTHQFDHVAKGAVGMFMTGDGEPGAAKPAKGDHMTMAH
jgi:nitrite reductase (NO-forming)